MYTDSSCVPFQVRGMLGETDDVKAEQLEKQVSNACVREREKKKNCTRNMISISTKNLKVKINLALE